uniref:ATP synthase complex subunit 8 n=1 Tax=Scarites buparius TaxID=76544 RepID=A0A343EZ28_9CARA|nr:ATP synthase F0 subunit 8 [Scarites buparius]
MPQMAPMNWLILYIFFIMIFMLFNFFNYYMFLIKNNTNDEKTFTIKILNWKW